MNRSSLILLLSLTVAAGAPAAERAGRTAASFLEVTPSPRLTALGGPQAAAAGHVDALFSNPASLTSLSTPEIWLTHNDSYIGSTYETLAMGGARGRQALGLAVQYINDGSFERLGVGDDGEPVGDLGRFRSSTLVLNGGLARQLTSRLSLGGATKIWREDIGGHATRAAAFDGGLFMRDAVGGLDLALALRNVGPSVRGHSLPTEVTLGAALEIHKTAAGEATLYSSLGRVADRRLNGSAGVDVRRGLAHLRAGYTSVESDLNDTLAQFTLGGGLRIKGWNVDYAWSPRADLGNQHQIALTFALGMTPEERTAAARALDDAMANRAKKNAALAEERANDAARRNDWSSAVKEYTRALTWAPTDVRLIDRLAQAQAAEKKSQAEALLTEGRRLAKKQEWLDAAGCWRQALKIDPTLSEATTALADAKQHIARANRKNVVSAEDAAFHEGVSLYLDGDFSGALKRWEKVSASQPDRPFLREYVAKAEKMVLNQELERVRQSKKGSQDNVETLDQQAYTLYSLGQTDDAIAAWERVLALDPNHAGAKKAIAEARDKRRLSEGNTRVMPTSAADALNVKAVKAYNQGHLDEAAVLWKKALALDPKNLWVRNSLKRVENELAAQGWNRDAE